MNTQTLPSNDEMYQALIDRDSEYEGVFFCAVKTTGIFCRPTCTARKPKRENVEFFRTVNDALASGYRPCKRCRPLEVFGEMPTWIKQLLEDVESEPSRRWTDADLRAGGIQPAKLRRWFKQHHDMTFQKYLRSRRMSQALGQISVGGSVTGAALDNGYQSLSGFRDAFTRWCGQVPKMAKTGSPAIMVNRLLTPLGPMVVAAVDEAIGLLEFADRRMLETQFKRLVKLHQRQLATGKNDVIVELSNQLEEYFAGSRTKFDIPIKMPGSEFQMRVWNRLVNIPYGQTISYEQLSREIDRPGAQRAVGRANGDNRLAIIVPCHRVIRSDGSLSGYGGGVWRKQRLLDHESSQLSMDLGQD